MMATTSTFSQSTPLTHGRDHDHDLDHDHDHDSIPLSSYKLPGFHPTAVNNGLPNLELAKLWARKLFQSLLFKRILSSLTPSYMTSRKNISPSKPRKIRPTAYLDGIRGVAAFLVLLHHYILDYFRTLQRGYLTLPGDTLLLQLPFVRILYSGRFMVSLFFVLSGYVLAHKPLQLIHDGNTAALLESLSSSVFRRSMRLFFPVVISSYIAMVLIHNGCYKPVRSPVSVPPIVPLGEQTAEWLSDLQGLVNPFTWARYSPIYAYQLWTLPIEFRGSFIVFISLLGLAKAKTVVRMAFIGFLALYCFYYSEHYYLTLFLAGILLAESSHLQKGWNFSWDSIYDARKVRIIKLAIRSCWTAVFLFSWFIACWPDHDAKKAPGYISLASITPSQYASQAGMTRFWTSIAAILMLTAMENNPVLQRPFTSNFAVYLGEISFSLYIVHTPLIHSIGRVITVKAIELTGMKVIGFLLGASLVVPLVMWVADVYSRLVDTKSVELARWIWIKSCKA